MHEPNNRVNLTEIESALAALTPAPAVFHRDALLFRAGQASVKRGWIWPATSGVLASVVAALGYLLMMQPQSAPLRDVEVVAADGPAEPKPAAAPERHVADHGDFPQHRFTSDYRNVQYQLLRWGLDALPDPPRLVAESASIRAPTQKAPETPGLKWFHVMFDSGERL
jgi:hypothetical protein